MWFFRRIQLRSLPIQRAANTIGTGSVVRGDLRGNGGFQIDGHVAGSVHSDGTVIVGERGSVEGTIVAANVVVLGHARGDIHASGHLEIGPAGQVLGDVTIASFRMHMGGVFRGMSRMPSAGELPASAPIPALHAPAHEHSGRTLPPPGDGAVPPPAGVVEIAPSSGAIALPPARSKVQKVNASGLNPRRTIPLVDEEAELVERAG